MQTDFSFTENLLTGAILSEYHIGYREFSRKLLEKLSLENNSDDFVFDNQMLAQILWRGNIIAEVSCPLYFPEASSINCKRSVVKYGFGCLGTGIAFRTVKLGLVKSQLFVTHKKNKVISNT